MLGRIKTDAGSAVLDAACVREIAHIGTFYGQLVYLASLRNPDTGKYEYYGVTPKLTSTQDANRTFRRIHEQVFTRWIGLTLERKMADIELYISNIGQVDQCELIDAWLRLTPYKNLVPASIQGPERERHASDFEAILGLLKNVYGVASPHPGV